jgi:hypothetical protein
MRTLDFTHVSDDELGALQDTLAKIPNIKGGTQTILVGLTLMLMQEWGGREAGSRKCHPFDPPALAAASKSSKEALREHLQSGHTELVNAGHHAAAGILDEMLSAIEESITGAGDR